MEGDNLIIINKLILNQKRRSLLITFIFFFSLLSISGIVFAEDDLAYNNLKVENQYLENFDSNKYLNNFIKIPLKSLEEVTRTDSEGLKRNLLTGGAVLGSAYYLDQNVRDYVQENMYAGDTGLSKLLYNFGNPKKVLPVYSGLYLYSKLSSDKYLENTLYYTFQSLLVTQGFTTLLKNTVKRDRPRNSKDDPFSRTGGKSFISGHSSGAWATMTIFAKRYPQTRYLSYGFASLVSASRIYEDAHWFSDILAGSFVGYQIGKLSVSLNDAFPEDITISPVYDGNLAGLAVNIKH